MYENLRTFVAVFTYSAIMQPIFLIGYMGCGKTTLGKALGKVLGREFIDLDTYIERRFHATVRQIFAQRGEDGFRDVERRMLHEVADFEDVIVACGGGTPCYFDNMDHMLSRGVTVYLTVPPERIALRLALPGSRAKRPLIAGKSDEELLAFVVEALAKREPFYSRAQLTFCSERIENAEETMATAHILAEIIANL